jgi:hypothetical protein
MSKIANRGPDKGYAKPTRGSLTSRIAMGLLIYGLLSGLGIRYMDFGVTVQLSVIVHTLVGLLGLLPLLWFAVQHWRCRHYSGIDYFQITANVALLVLLFCLFSGLVLAWQAGFRDRIDYDWRSAHLVTSLLVFGLLGGHLLFQAGGVSGKWTTETRSNHLGYWVIPITIVALLFVGTWGWSLTRTTVPSEIAFPEDYDWQFGDDRPFAPSLASLSDPSWQKNMLASLAPLVGPDGIEGVQDVLENGFAEEVGPIHRVQTALDELNLPPSSLPEVAKIVDQARMEMRSGGALNPAALEGSKSCGVAGCHEAIYREWQPSAHGFSAIDEVFLEVQAMMARERTPSHTRWCAGCHDPVSLFSGARDGNLFTASNLGTHEGTSCLICHSIVDTDSAGNGAYVVKPPERYQFELDQGGFADFLSQFLIRAYPDHHIATFKRPLYKEATFCAACHKQAPGPELSTASGLTQEKSEYDSWVESRWYHPDDSSRHISCRECHMPLLDTPEPASGDTVDSYRNEDDGKHRSHRFLASNSYIPISQNLEGGKEHAELTTAWLRGEIDIPEIADKWTEGPVVKMELIVPETAAPGEMVNLQLKMSNNKTGHAFPAGPLDILESWVELTVTDDQDNIIARTGGETSDVPTQDSVVVFKADWYDKRGMPVERHNLWDVVGASYEHVLESGEDDVVNIPFRCPVLARPRVSGTASSDSDNARLTDVVMWTADSDVKELRVSARLLFRRANPDFLDKVYGLSSKAEAPIIELSRASGTIQITAETGDPAIP